MAMHHLMLNIIDMKCPIVGFGALPGGRIQKSPSSKEALNT